MALTFSEKVRVTLGTAILRAYTVTADGSTQTINASDLDMHYIETAALGQRNDLEGTLSLDIASIADTSGTTSVAITVTGAALGDYVWGTASIDLVSLSHSPYVQTTNTVEIRVDNDTAGGVNLGDTTWKARVAKNIGLSTHYGDYIVFGPALTSGDTFNLWVIGW